MSKCCDFCNESLFEPHVNLMESPNGMVHICETCTILVCQQFKEIKQGASQEVVKYSNSQRLRSN